MYKLIDHINSDEALLHVSPVDNHNARIEAQIEVVKICRTERFSSPAYCTSQQNKLRIDKKQHRNVSPFTKFYNEALDYNKHLSISFGAYYQTTNPLCDNSLTERTQGAIDKMVVRRTLKELPMPDVLSDTLTKKPNKMSSVEVVPTHH